MITDTTEALPELLLKPHQGFAAGMAGALLTAVFLWALPEVFPLAPAAFLTALGQFYLPDGLPASTLIAGGLLFHLLGGGIWGVLYALSQQPAPLKGLIGVGVFYGILQWILGHAAALALPAPLGQMLHSWQWLALCLVYSLCLTAPAVLSNQPRPARPLRVALD